MLLSESKQGLSQVKLSSLFLFGGFGGEKSLNLDFSLSKIGHRYGFLLLYICESKKHHSEVLFIIHSMFTYYEKKI